MLWTTSQCTKLNKLSLFSWIVVLNNYDVIKEALVTKGSDFAGRVYDPRQDIVYNVRGKTGKYSSVYLTLCTSSGFIVLPHCRTAPTAQWPDISLSHIIFSLSLSSH